jgi:N-acetylglucosamine-6-sulfatase
MVLKSCSGLQCTEPWHELHPDGKVSSLKDAMNISFDSFYGDQPKVSFSACEAGYIKSSEGPQQWNSYRGSRDDSTRSKRLSFNYDEDWSVYT